MRRDFQPVHPGVILREIIGEMGISQSRLAHDIGVSPMRVSYIINGSRPMTGDIALRIGKYLRQSPQFWMNLQSNYDIQIAQEKIIRKLTDIKPVAVIPKSQQWFWQKEWLNKEKEASKDLKEGRYKDFKKVGDLLKDLKD